MIQDKIASNLYKLAASGRFGADFLNWEFLLDNEKQFFAAKAESLILSLVREEIEKCLLGQKELDDCCTKVFSDFYNKTTPMVAGKLEKEIAKAQLQSILKALGG